MTDPFLDLARSVSHFPTLADLLTHSARVEVNAACDRHGMERVFEIKTPQQLVEELLDAQQQGHD